METVFQYFTYDIQTEDSSLPLTFILLFDSPIQMELRFFIRLVAAEFTEKCNFVT